MLFLAKYCVDFRNIISCLDVSGILALRFNLMVFQMAKNKDWRSSVDCEKGINFSMARKQAISQKDLSNLHDSRNGNEKEIC